LYRGLFVAKSSYSTRVLDLEKLLLLSQV